MRKPTDHAQIDAYFAAKAAVHAIFKYKADWVEIPLEDQREMHWMLTNGEGVNSTCVYSDEPFTEDSIRAGSNIYSGPIYTQRFLKVWVYRAPLHVLVAVNTQTDGNRFLMIFDADKKCTDDTLRRLYRANWKGEGFHSP